MKNRFDIKQHQKFSQELRKKSLNLVSCKWRIETLKPHSAGGNSGKIKSNLIFGKLFDNENKKLKKKPCQKSI